MSNSVGSSASGSVVDRFTGVMMHQYSRRGWLRLLGTLGLSATAVAAGVGLPKIASACIPGAYCDSNCSICTVSCNVGTFGCVCNCSGPGQCGCPCAYAHGYFTDLCVWLCNCKSCNSC